jgi:hypothetical protein
VDKYEVDRLFLISSFGQLNNAVSLIASNGWGEQINCCVILWTKANRQIADKLSLKAQLNFSYVERVCLPLNPTSGSPYTVYKCSQAYKRLLSKFKVQSVWVANTTSHYATFLNICRDSGIELNYFEEGLGTYKSREMLLYPSSSKATIRKFGLEIKRAFLIFAHEFWLDQLFKQLKFVSVWIYRKCAAPFLLFIRLLSAFTKYLFSNRLIKVKVGKFLPGHYGAYYRIHEEFKEIRVVYPDYLDKNAYRGNVLNFPFSRENYLLNEDEFSIIESLGIVLDSESILYVSQKYSSDSIKWAKILAETFKTKSITNIFIKFHPKEKPSERTVILSTLNQSGVSVIDIDPENNLDALKLVTCLNFKVVYGLTSSVLFYGKKLAPKSEFLSLAPNLYAVSVSKGFCRGGIDTMMGDYKLISRFIY